MRVSIKHPMYTHLFSATCRTFIRRLFCGLLLMTPLVSPQVTMAKNKKKCNSTELSLKNCQLQVQNVKLNFLEDKILVHDGVWRTLEKWPLIGQSTEWKDIQVTPVNSQLYVQIWIWTEPKGETEVQNLKWYVFQIHPRSLNLVFEESVQKRNRNLNYPKDHFFYDKIFPHSLKSVNGQAVIQFKDTKTTLPKIKESN